MKILIAADMEGITGVVDSRPHQPQPRRIQPFPPPDDR